MTLLILDTRLKRPRYRKPWIILPWVMSAFSLLLFTFSASAEDLVDAAIPEEIGPESTEQDAAIPPDSGTLPAAIVAPQLAHFEQATYPSEAEKQDLEASVLLQIEVDDTGRVVAVEVREGAGYGFDEAAVAAAKRFVFEPATQEGVPIAAKILYRYDFKHAPPTPPAQSATEAQLPETGELRGVIVAGTPPKPVAGAEIRVRSASTATVTLTTSADGTWAVPKLAPGEYEVQVQADGYRPAHLTERVDSGRATALKYVLQSASEAEIDVVVRGPALHREVTHYKLSRTELVRVPGTIGDSIHAVEAMPSVARAIAFTGDLVVRGSAPADTQVFVEGTLVPRVFHYGNISSVVPSEMIETVEFYPSNFSVLYGRGTGGVVDVGLRLTNPDGQYHGSAQVDFLNARANAEGPIPLVDDWRFMSGLRATYVDLWLGPVLRGSDSAINGLPRYYDYQLYIERRLDTEGGQGVFRLGFFGAHDVYVPIEEDPVDWRSPEDTFWHVQPQLRLPLSSIVDLKATCSIGRIATFTPDEQERMYRTTAILSMLRAELAVKTGSFGIARVGTDSLYAPFNVEGLWDEQGASGQLASQAAGSPRLQHYDIDGHYFRPAAFTEYEFTPTQRIDITAGTRLDYTKGTSQTDVAPRGTARYVLVDKPISTVLKAGLGLFYQPPDPYYTLPELGHEGLVSSRAIHSMLGVEQSLTERVTLSVEGFEKELQRLIVGRIDGSGNYSLENTGRGRVFGADILLRYHPDERFFGWIAYTISRSTRQPDSGEPTRLFYYDQPHILNILASYRLGRGWEIGGRFRLISGFIYSSWSGGIFDNSTGHYRVYGPMIRKRMPPYHQLDLRVEKIWKFNGFRLSAYLDLINAYNHWSPDIARRKYDLSETKLLSLSLPIVPSLGVRGEL